LDRLSGYSDDLKCNLDRWIKYVQDHYTTHSRQAGLLGGKLEELQWNKPELLHIDEKLNYDRFDKFPELEFFTLPARRVHQGIGPLYHAVGLQRTDCQNSCSEAGICASLLPGSAHKDQVVEEGFQ
jgi:hypothetical protein